MGVRRQAGPGAFACGGQEVGIGGGAEASGCAARCCCGGWPGLRFSLCQRGRMRGQDRVLCRLRLSPGRGGAFAQDRTGGLRRVAGRREEGIAAIIFECAARRLGLGRRPQRRVEIDGVVFADVRGGGVRFGGRLGPAVLCGIGRRRAPVLDRFEPVGQGRHGPLDRGEGLFGFGPHGGHAVMHAAQRILDPLGRAFLGLAQAFLEVFLACAAAGLDPVQHLGHAVGRRLDDGVGTLFGLDDTVGERAAHAGDFFAHAAHGVAVFLAHFVQAAVQLALRLGVAHRVGSAALALGEAAVDGAGQLGNLAAQTGHAVALAPVGLVHARKGAGQGVFQAVDTRFGGGAVQRFGDLGAGVGNNARNVVGEPVEAAFQVHRVGRIAGFQQAQPVVQP